MKAIIHAVVIHAPAARIYGALTTQSGVIGWWTTKAALAEGEGGVIRFTFAGDFNPHMEQTRLVPGSRVEWRCTAGHDNWQDNTFQFALESRGDDTLLMFRQHYARELSDEVYGTYNFNWGYYLGSLKAHCEHGTGTPFSPE